MWLRCNRLAQTLLSGHLFVCCMVLQASAEKRVALVVGNDNYANLPMLRNAVNDAQVVGDTLRRVGFEVVRGRDLGRQAMIDKLAELTSRIDAGDTALFFYAGHGVAIGGVNYLVPIDAPAASSGAEPRVRGASIAEGDVIAEIQARGARVAVLVLDACRDNPFPRAGTRTVGNTRGLADAKPARGVFTVYSAGIGQTALDRLEPSDPHRNSVFTRVFVEHLDKPNVHLGELAIEVREKVAALALKAKNTHGEPDPHEQTPAYYDQTIGGRVFLAGRNAAAEEKKRDPVMAPVVRQDPCALAGDHWRSTEAIGSKGAFEEHLARFPNCTFAGLARAKLVALDRAMAEQNELDRKRKEAEATARDKQLREGEERKKRWAAIGPTPALLGRYENWGVYVGRSQSVLNCYALSKPHSSRSIPAKFERGNIFLLVSNRPAQRVNEEVSLFIGYTFKAGGEASIEIGARQFSLFTQGDKAWVRNVADERDLAEAMRSGDTLLVKGLSENGARTEDRYRLRGLKDALERSAKECEGAQ